MKRVFSSASLHWLAERLSAVLLLALSYWPLCFAAYCLHAPYSEMLAWLQTPLNKNGLIIWFLLVGYHGSLGMQVVFDDYLSPRYRRAAIWSARACFAGLALSVSFLLAPL